MALLEGVRLENMDDDLGGFEEYQIGTHSSLLETKDVMDMYGKFQFRTVAYQTVDDTSTKYPAHFKSKEDMEINDVVKEHALPFLPAKSLTRFRLVCKEWDRWIKTPFLAFKQSLTFRDISGFFCQSTNSSPIFVTFSRPAYGVPAPSLGFLPESVDIRSSCNGLLLCQGWHGENCYYICNPVTKEWKWLPRPGYYNGSEPAVVLAFEPSVFNIGAEFQVVSAVTLLDQLIVCFEIYSSDTYCWKPSAADCTELGDSSLTSNGFYMKGIAYWLTTTDKVLAFDLENEHVGILILPSRSTPGGILAEMHGELCYICIHNQVRNICLFDIYGGVDMTLKHRISVNLGVGRIIAENCRILGFVNNDAVVFVTGDVMYSYQLSDQTIEVISRRELDAQMRCLPYVNSLVWLQ